MIGGKDKANQTTAIHTKLLEIFAFGVSIGCC
jgi:hypothetical protein